MANLMLSKVVDQAKREQQAQERQRITQQELEAAWKVICPNGSSLSRHEAEELLRLFYPTMQPKYVRELAGHGVSLEMLQELLVDQPQQGVDACHQGFAVLDPGKTGAVDMDTLKRLMQHLHNIQQLSDEDVVTLMQLADVDMDGKINLQDFSHVFARRQRSSGVGAVQQAAAAAADQIGNQG